MGQTLTNGIFLPNEGERNCYTGLADNWRAIDGYIGGYNVHVADAVIHVSQADRDKWDAVDDKADASALTAHTGDTTIHVTAADKEAWNGKADASALTAHTGNTTIHVTAEDKNKWDAVTGKADDASVMHLTGDETSTGKKVFGDMATFDGSYLGNEASTNARTDLVLESNRDTHGQSGIYITKFRQNKAQGEMSGNDIAYLGFDCLENSVRTNNGFRINFLNFVNDIPQRFMLWSGITERLLGAPGAPWSDVSTNKINSLNPGVLSMPNLSAGVDISGYITAGNNHNEYTPTVDGWISVTIQKTTSAGNLALFIYQGGICNSYFGNTSLPNESEFTGMASIPVKAGIVVNIDTKGATTYIYSAKFYPCTGNV